MGRARSRLPIPELTFRNPTLPIDFVVAKVTPTLETDLGYKLFLMFATINIGGMAVFSLWVPFPVFAMLRHACSLAYPRPFAFVGLSPRRRDAVWRRWTSSLGLCRRTNGGRTSRRRHGVSEDFAH